MYTSGGTKFTNISMNNHLIVHGAAFTGFPAFYTAVD